MRIIILVVRNDMTFFSWRRQGTVEGTDKYDHRYTGRHDHGSLPALKSGGPHEELINALLVSRCVSTRELQLGVPGVAVTHGVHTYGRRVHWLWARGVKRSRIHSHGHRIETLLKGAELPPEP